jgi:hypothetical protein
LAVLLPRRAGVVFLISSAFRADLALCTAARAHRFATLAFFVAAADVCFALLLGVEIII